MSIINRYLLREALYTVIAVLLVLLLILLGGLFAKMLGQVAAGKIDVTVLLPLVFVVGIKSFPTLITVALYLGVLVTLGRFYKDSEMTALRAGGVGYQRIARPLLLMAFITALFVAWLSFHVQPQAQQMQDNLRSEAAQYVDIAGITPGKFIQIPSTGSVVFAESIVDDALQNVYMFSMTPEGMRVVAADSALQLSPEESLNILEMQSGAVFEMNAQQSDISLVEFSKQGLQLPNDQEINYRTRLSSTPTLELLNSNELAERAEIQWRLAYPLSAFLLVVLALPLSYTTPRKGQFTKLALAIVIYIVYQNLLGVAQNWMVKSVTPAWLGIWWVHLLLIVLTFWLLSRQYPLQYLLSRFKPGKKLGDVR